MTLTEAFPDAGKSLKQTNRTSLTPPEVEEMVRLLMEADGQTVWDRITAHLRDGKSLKSTFEEYQHNSTHLRDRLLLATARLLAGWPKMPGERDCYGRYMKEWIRN